MNRNEQMEKALELALSLLDVKEGFKSFGQAEIDTIKQALALPRRNCDVGTAEEQTDRYWDFCSNNHVKGCFTDGNPMSCPSAA